LAAVCEKISIRRRVKKVPPDDKKYPLKSAPEKSARFNFQMRRIFARNHAL
jgi:hypothetical protein